MLDAKSIALNADDNPPRRGDDIDDGLRNSSIDLRLAHSSSKSSSPTSFVASSALAKTPPLDINPPNFGVPISKSSLELKPLGNVTLGSLLSAESWSP